MLQSILIFEKQDFVSGFNSIYFVLKQDQNIISNVMRITSKWEKNLQMAKKSRFT
jgi:hypothetical protein